MKKAEKQFRLNYSRLVTQAGWSLFSILFFCYLRAVALTFAPGSLPEPEHIYPLQPDPVDIQSANSSETSNGLGALQIQGDSFCYGSGFRRQGWINGIACADLSAAAIYSLFPENSRCAYRADWSDYTNLLLKICLDVRAGPAAEFV